MAEQVDRFRSFTERYVIARAAHFEIGREQEQAWLAIQDAKKIYGMVAEAKNETDPIPDWPAAGQAGTQQAPQTGPPLAFPNRPGGMVTGTLLPGARNAAKASNPALAPYPMAPTLGRLQRMAHALKGY